MTDKKIDLGPLPITLMGFFFYYCAPFRKKVIQRNVDIVYKNTISPSHKKRLIVAFYSHFFKSIKELILLGLLGSKRLERKVILLGVEHYISAASQQKGVLLLVGHLGNWEFSQSIVVPTLQKLDCKFCIIRRAIKIRWIEQFLFKRIEDSGVLIINKQGARKKIAPALKDGYGVIFAMDQHACIKENVGIAVDFFDATAGTYMGLAINAQAQQAPVVPLCSYRQKDGTHVVEFHPPVEWQEHSDYEQGIYENTRRYNQKLEKMILAHPEQWYWIHRRWKLPLSPERS